MTRDRAIEIASAHKLAGEVRLIDCLVALGLLKLEEPKTVEERLADFMENFGVTPALVKNALKATGLKIVKA